MKIGIVGTQSNYAAPFIQHGDVVLLPDMDAVCREKVDILVFTGGEDVTPAMYSEPAHPSTGNNQVRDEFELRAYVWGKNKGAKMCGICRGSQFLTVMNGGKLVQHVNNHANVHTHTITDTAWEEYEITSTHHQMMYPFNLKEGEDYILLAYASPRRASVFQGLPKGAPVPPVDVEVLWYPKTKCLAVQGHPEYMPHDSSGWLYYQHLLAEYIL